jgi:hypothetical protein
MVCDATLTNHFESAYEVYYGSYGAIMLRDGKAWIFKETDSPNFGWEVYARKDTFYDETGIALVAGASKSVPTDSPGKSKAFTTTPLAAALNIFLRNVDTFLTKEKEAIAAYSAEDTQSIMDELVKVQKLPAPGYLEGYRATAMAIKANEAIFSGQRIVLESELFEIS